MTFSGKHTDFKFKHSRAKPIELTSLDWGENFPPAPETTGPSVVAEARALPKGAELCLLTSVYMANGVQ